MEDFQKVMSILVETAMILAGSVFLIGVSIFTVGSLFK